MTAYLALVFQLQPSFFPVFNLSISIKDPLKEEESFDDEKKEDEEKPKRRRSKGNMMSKK